LEPKEKKKRNITIHDIAEKLGLSSSTVSRALNDHPKINIKTKEQVWELAKKMGYYPNVPVYMNKNTGDKYCLIIPAFDQLHIDIIKGARQYLAKKEINLYISCSNNHIDTEQNMVSELLDLGFKGFMLSVFDKEKNYGEMIRTLPQDAKLVTINKFDGDSEISKIVPDIYNGAFRAVNHLASVGCKNIVLITGETTVPIYQELLAGFDSAMSLLNLPRDKESVYFTNFKQEDVAYGIERILSGSKKPDGIIVGAQLAAQQIISYIRNVGLNVPNDILLISFGDERFSAFVSPTISSVSFSGQNIGRLAAKKLYHTVMNNSEITETIVEQTKLIIRGSSLRIQPKT
jgi:LacI family transcriptional regulator